MAKLGILGLGMHSTLWYLQALNEQYNQTQGGYSTCPFTLLNADFDQINPLLPNYSEQLDHVLNQRIHELLATGIDTLLVPNITLHETLDVIHAREPLSVEIIHPLALSLASLRRKGFSKVVLFGSLHSMTSPYLRNYFNTNAITVATPSEDDMKDLDAVRRRVYVEGKSQEMTNKLQSLSEKYSKQHTVVIACTELSIVHKHNTNANVIDMAEQQIQHAVALC